MGTKKNRMKRIKRMKKSKKRQMRLRGGEYVSPEEYQSYNNPMNNMNNMNNSNDTDTFDENELYKDRHGPVVPGDFNPSELMPPYKKQRDNYNTNYMQTPSANDALIDKINDYNTRCSGMFKTKSSDCISTKNNVEGEIDNIDSREKLHSIYQKSCPKNYGMKNTSSLCKKLDNKFTSLPTANSRLSFNYDFNNAPYQNRNSEFPPELEEEETKMLSRGNGGKKRTVKRRKSRK